MGPNLYGLLPKANLLKKLKENVKLAQPNSLNLNMSILAKTPSYHFLIWATTRKDLTPFLFHHFF
jgi:hypothetical protein